MKEKNYKLFIHFNCCTLFLKDNFIPISGVKKMSNEIKYWNVVKNMLKNK